MFRVEVKGVVWLGVSECGPLFMGLQVVIRLNVYVEREAKVPRGHAVDKTIRPK